MTEATDTIDQAPDPRHVYRPQALSNEALSGRRAEYITVDASELPDYLSSGWYSHPDDFPVAPVEAPNPILKLLDESAKAIDENIPALTLEEVTLLIAAESAGKTRKGVVASLEAAREKLTVPLATED